MPISLRFGNRDAQNTESAHITVTAALFLEIVERAKHVNLRRVSRNISPGERKKCAHLKKLLCETNSFDFFLSPTEQVPVMNVSYKPQKISPKSKVKLHSVRLLVLSIGNSSTGNSSCNG